jgi:NOL1/NOP2/sun family putative RNA methylase
LKPLSNRTNLPFEPYREIIPDFEDFQESLSHPLPVHFRINTLKIDPMALVAEMRWRGIDVLGSYPGDYTLYHGRNVQSPGNLPEYYLGHIHLQALTSCLASLVLAPEPGSFVLDMCASPGGKSSHMAQLMENSGLIVSNELYTKRHVQLGDTLTRLGAMNCVVTGYQAQQFPSRQKFDYVLADVPCSGEGRFRRRGEKDTYRVKRGRSSLPSLQKKILLRGYDLLKPGGRMVYATCTYDPLENESVVQYLLTHRDAALEPIVPKNHAEPGVEFWKGEVYDRCLQNTIRFYPHRVDSVGFFLAKISKPR